MAKLAGKSADSKSGSPKAGQLMSGTKNAAGGMGKGGGEKSKIGFIKSAKKGR